jgi:predicted ribosome-associated RNA-binding protein Tma20
MIKAYMAAFSTLYEGEDIEVRYSLIQDDQVIKEESVYLEYMKPAVVGVNALLILLRKLEAYKQETIVITINDGALNEIIRGTNTTQNGEVLKLAGKIKKELSKFQRVSFVNVTNKDRAELAEWKEVLGI